MRPLFAPRLVNGEFGDPALFVDLPDERRALLFDLGELNPLAPRHLLRLTHVFVSHTHVDHFAGFDTLLRVLLGRQRRLVLMGGPGFVAQVGHKLAAYTWNVVHRYEVELVLEVHEFDPRGSVRRAGFSSRRGFVAEAPADGAAECAWDGETLLDEVLLRVRGRFVDHEMPCLAFALDEKARPRFAKDRLVARGLGTGPWLRELRQAVLAGAPAATPIALRWRDERGEHAAASTVGALADIVLDFSPGRRLGYVTDLRFSPENRRALGALLAGVDRLYIESAFLEADAAHAARKNHLTAAQAGTIARELGAREVVPFHFSPRYAGRGGALQAELRATWLAGRGAAPLPGAAG